MPTGRRRRGGARGGGDARPARRGLPRGDVEAEPHRHRLALAVRPHPVVLLRGHLRHVLELLRL
eukprot:5845130-Prymnesium_polylepis.1